MAALRDAGIVLEICPTSNLLTKALADEAAVHETFRAFGRCTRIRLLFGELRRTNLPQLGPH